MASSKVRVTVVKDSVDGVFASLRDLLGQQVLIGIPEEQARAESAISNATIAYIQEFGSPAANIPARPFLVPGVQKSRAGAVKQIRAALEAATNGDLKGALQAMNRAGLVGTNAVKNEILTADYVALRPATIRNRARQRGDATRRAAETQYLKAVAAGTPPAVAQTEAGVKPLVNTGQLLNSITYVVRKK